MNSAPALLAIPEYDYIVIELAMEDTHARREGRKRARNYFKSKREAARLSSLSGKPPPVRGVAKSLYTFHSCDTMTSIKYFETATVPPTYGGAVFCFKPIRGNT